MPIVRLKKDQLGFLLSNIGSPEVATALINNIRYPLVYPNQKVEIDLSNEMINKLLFEIAIVLAGVGFGEDSEPNEQGYYIEDIIDGINNNIT